MRTISKIGIIGMGLIGGSLAKALKRANPELIIMAMDVNPEYTNSAYRESVIDVRSDSIEKIVSFAQVIFICTPVPGILHCIESLSQLNSKDLIISDTGSTKLEIVEKAQHFLHSGMHFIGGHPMAGTEQSGYNASFAHLFENAYYVLTPTSVTPPEYLELLTALVASTGALPIVMDANTHDYVVGSISHLPHVLAAALVNSVNEINDPMHYKFKLAAGGFKDITRIASSNPKMWKEISLSNKSHLTPLINSVISSLSSFNNWLDLNESDKIELFYRSAKDARDQIATSKLASFNAYFDLYVDIEDKPGLIGKIATLLGYHNINIKNLRIIHSREDEPQGCLVVSFSDSESVNKSKIILSENGFKSYER